LPIDSDMDKTFTSNDLKYNKKSHRDVIEIRVVIIIVAVINCWNSGRETVIS
jgi:hypothetical protein